MTIIDSIYLIHIVYVFPQLFEISGVHFKGLFRANALISEASTCWSSINPINHATALSSISGAVKFREWRPTPPFFKNGKSRTLFANCHSFCGMAVCPSLMSQSRAVLVKAIKFFSSNGRLVDFYFKNLLQSLGRMH